MLLHICTNINYKELSDTNITFKTPSKSMEEVFNQPRVALPISLVDLIQQTLVLTKDHDHLSIQSKYLSIQMVGDTLAPHTLSRNFVMDRVTNLNNEVNFINPSAFLPQRNLCMIEQDCLKDFISKTENSMDVLDAHKLLKRNTRYNR